MKRKGGPLPLPNSFWQFDGTLVLIKMTNVKEEKERKTKTLQRHVQR